VQRLLLSQLLGVSEVVDAIVSAKSKTGLFESSRAINAFVCIARRFASARFMLVSHTGPERIMRLRLLTSLLLLLSANVSGAQPNAANPYAPSPYVTLQHPGWSQNAVLYQLNTRQFTAEGTFNAARAQLPRLKDMGIGIVWLMPVHPIGVKHRKGTLGSPYAVKDYYGINPEFGTLDDLKAFVAEAHRLGLRVILDWVANHTAWDNPLLEQHPDWYERDWQGHFRPTPWWDWSDIIDLDYRQPGLRKYMTEAMAWWVREADIDGFRCDVAGYVPLDFWENLRRELDAIKPVFMLAEVEQRDVHARAFDATYAWSWNNTVHNIAQGKTDATALFGFYSENESAWPHDAYRMTYTENHDQNAWEGTAFERFGKALQPAIVLSMLGEGVPLIHNGQEAGNEKRLAFFEKDPIAWRAHSLDGFFRKLIALKHRLSALRNGKLGARMVPVVNSDPKAVFSFVRANADDGVLVALNFTGEAKIMRLIDGPFRGQYRDAFSDEVLRLDTNASLHVDAWGHRVLLRQP
jgi:glycosidase